MLLRHKIILFSVLITAHFAKAQYEKINSNPSERLGIPNNGKPDPVYRIRSSNTGHHPYTSSHEQYTPSHQQYVNTPIPPPLQYPSDISFRFSNVGLQRIGRNFITSNRIISLSLDNNNISDISPFAFRSMSNLRHLNLSGNRIPKKKLLSLNGNNNLQTLIINNNNDSDIPNNSNEEEILKESETFQSLEHLQLCNNQLGDIEVSFFISMPILTHLHLTNNSIRSSSAIFDNIPTTLTHLNLNKNLIDHIDQDKLRYLHELVMDDNIITQVCFEKCQEKSIPLRSAIAMQNLSLSRNQIVEVSPDAFNDMEHLLNLDLSGNKIADLASTTFNNTPWMINLSLANNIFGTIPNVCPILNLERMNLTGNRISAISPDAFCRLQRLKYLYLSNNMITTIETRAFNLPSLMYLDLSGNQLRQLPAQWTLPWHIEELHLERNYFSDLDDLSLINIKSLKNVHLDGNPMLKLEIGSLHEFSARMTLHLKNIFVDEAKYTQCPNEKDNEDNGNSDYDDNY